MDDTANEEVTHESVKFWNYQILLKSKPLLINGFLMKVYVKCFKIFHQLKTLLVIYHLNLLITVLENQSILLIESKERDVTYAAPLRVKVRLVNKETGEVKEQDVFMGDFPLMTETGTLLLMVQNVLLSLS